jgi:hypothetical protein
MAVGIGGFELWKVATAPSEQPAPPEVDDDLAMLATLTDAAPTFPRLLAVSGGKRFTTHGAEGAIEVEAVGDAGRDGGRAAPVPHLSPLGVPIAAVALGGDALWVAAGSSVRRIPLDGSAPQIVTDKLTHPQALAADAHSVVVVDLDATTPGLLRASRVLRLAAHPDGSFAAPAVLGRYPGEVSNVALDDGTAYWADRLEGSLLSSASAAVDPRVLLRDRGLPGQVLVVGDTLVWVEERSDALWAMPKTGGVPRQLAQDFAGFAHLVARRRRVAWVNEAAVDGKYTVLEVPLEGGDTVALTEPVEAIDALASDGERLYMLRDGVVTEVSAD